MYASVDLGGTTIAYALASADGRIIAERSMPTQSHEGPLTVLARIGALVKELAAETGVMPQALASACLDC
jgi:predicted NBD/HSP70 family sugar kinase